MKSLFAELYEKTFQNFKEGDVVRGKIVARRAKDVVVDIGYKAEGVLSLDEFLDPSSIQEGMEVEVLFESFDDEHGVVILSKRKADRQRTWSDLLVNSQEGSIVEGKIFKKVRGGFMADIGMEAFLPASLVDIKPTRNLDQFLGLTSKFVIVKINQKRKNVVVSRKDYLEKEKGEARTRKLESLKEDQVVMGRVKNITDFGVFIDLGDLDGLLHVTDMSWGRISHPSEMVKLGDELEVVVIGIDRVKGKVSLGLKQKGQDPWTTVEDKYTIGTQTKGKVVNILPYGAFVELEPGVEGLVHISELSWTKRVNHPSELLQTGDQVEVIVLNLDKAGKKISLGMKQMQDSPWSSIENRYHVGDHVKGTVRNLTEYGAFVELEPGIDGLVHISDISWTQKVNHPSEFLKKGDAVEVMVLSIDPQAQKISLGIKQLSDDPWDTLTKSLFSGLQTVGKVTRLANFGLFVELDSGVEGLVHISEIPNMTPVKLEKQFHVGDTIAVSVLHVDHEGRRIALTMKGETASLPGTR
ncbi:MAG: 30S ribosomal protein S1 [Candidatus Omnitrophica bacterium]|nr:30S ribosomal protein S1 [Candidatus Omnitrophota bacterium]MDD5670570.1 30S ribosomal protein S1 [Candidatus Omnitrophota bacterium]